MTDQAPLRLRYGQAIDLIARRLCTLRSEHPLRIAIDGRTASGKSTFAGALEADLQAAGRTAIHTSIDAFHHPRAIRYRQGRTSAEGYYKDARDLDAVVETLLKPLGPDGSRFYRTQSLDLERDIPVHSKPVRAGANDILLVDGTFLARPELTQYWDYFIFLEASPEITEERAVSRAGVAGTTQRELYRHRYQGAFNLYLREVDPWARADLCVDVDDFENVQLRFEAQS